MQKIERAGALEREKYAARCARSAFALVLSTACALSTTGCRRREVSVGLSATAIKATANEVTVEVRTEPEMRVSDGRRGSEAKTYDVDARGVARMNIPRAHWDGRLYVTAKDAHFMGGRRGFTQFDIGRFRAIPTPTPPLYATPLGVEDLGTSKDGLVALELQAEGPRTNPTWWWNPKSDTLRLPIAATPNARVRIATLDLPITDSGLADAEIRSRDIVLSVRASSVVVGRDSRKADAVFELPLGVTKDGTTATSTLTFRTSASERGNTWLRHALAPIADRTPFPQVAAPIDSVALLTADDGLRLFGSDGPLGRLRYIAIEKTILHDTVPGRERCIFHRYEDSEITIYDTQTANVVGRKKFAAPHVRCPTIGLLGHVATYVAEAKDIDAWLAKRAWK